MSPDGEFITHFTPVTPVDKLVARLATEIR
jgi:hypothetical protein